VAAHFACLLDLDGTMVDTDALHLRAYNIMLGERGRQVDAAYYKTHIMGFPNDEIMAGLFPDRPRAEHQICIERKESLFRSMLGHLEPTPGLRELLAWAERHAVPCAVVTNAPRANATAMLAGLGLGERFDAVVLGDELARGKPDPLPYLTALEHLRADAARAIAFEDSLSGIRAACGAGVHTVGVLSSLAEAPMRAAGAAHVVHDFRDAVLWQWLEQRTGFAPPRF
jgi:HAD superfamily hydrolase (TIGR01509 family)